MVTLSVHNGRTFSKSVNPNSLASTEHCSAASCEPQFTATISMVSPLLPTIPCPICTGSVARSATLTVATNDEQQETYLVLELEAT